MAEGDVSLGGIKGFMTKDIAGMPVFVWMIVVGAGIAAAYIVPKFTKSNTTGNAQPDATSTNAGTNASGLGLAVDPTTGLPYAVSGLVPSGNSASGTSGNIDYSQQINQILAQQNSINQVLQNLQQKGNNGGQKLPGGTDNRGVLPAGVWRGPTGVLHYTVSEQGPNSINSVASSFGLTGQQVAAIPENQSAYGQHNNGTGTLKTGTVLTLPSSVIGVSRSNGSWPGTR